VSIWLHNVLTPCTFHEENSQVLKDGRQLLNDLHSTSFDSDVILVTADVDSLYPSIPTEEACSLINDFLKEKGMDANFADFVCQALLLVLSCNTFSFDLKFWLQLQGTAMGTHCGPCFAILFLLILERRLLATWLFFKRFLDDLFLIFKTMAAATQFITDYNALHKNIKVKAVFSTHSVDFLNLTLFKGRNFFAYGKMDTKCYSKPFNNFLYLPFSSAHVAHQKKAFVKGLIVNAVVCSNHFDYFLDSVIVIYAHLRARGYPSSLLCPVITSVNYSDRERYLKPSPHSEKTGWFFLNLPFNSTFASINVSSTLRLHWHLIENTPEVAHFFDRPPVICWSKTKNIADFINSRSRSSPVKSRLLI
jgi:hypothetical protein